MVKATRMHAYDSQPAPDKSGWSVLTTITTFDRGKAASRKWKKENTLVSKRATTFTISSLFVESLIDQLCKLFEKDPVSQKRTYELICQKLYEMKLIDETYNVEEFQFMRSYYQRAVFHLLTVSNSPTLDTKLETFLNQSPSSLTLPPSNSSNIFDWSRYQNEFEQIDFIAEGGFGSVFRVRNKIDRCEYAIKKIYLRYRSKEQFIQSLREVRTLANLDHCNIVAYKAAWFEPFTGVITEGEDPENPELEQSEPESSISSEQEFKDEVEDDSGNIVFANKTEDISEEQSSIPSSSHDLLEEDHDANNKEGASSAFGSVYKKALNLSLKTRSLCDHNSKSTKRGCRGQKLIWSQKGYECVLHIQMQLCKESLRKWLDLRNEALQLLHKESFSDQDDSNESIDKSNQSCLLQLDRESLFIALQIFLKILKGVEYVHSMEIVHHDLKPSNIFVEGYEYSSSASKMKREQSYNEVGAESVCDGSKSDSSSHQQVRVGDFGLACHLSHPSTLEESENKEFEDETMAVIPTHFLEKFNCPVQMGHHPSKEEKEVIGTVLYAAPEQLKWHCNYKSDMYSLGIILFELLHPFFTGMERNKVISALRNGTIPDYFKLQYPEMATVIKDLLSNEPGDRPSIMDVIKKLEPILEGCRNFSKDELKISACVSKESSIEEVTHVRNSQSKDFHQVSCYEFKKFQTKESHTLSSSTSEETFQEEAQFSTNNCGSYTCHVMQEEQERTITKLKEENLKKDETIKKLRYEILQLQNSGKNAVIS